MKVVFASTPVQEEEIRDLVKQFYSKVFPLYFSDEEIKKIERSKVLHTTTRHFEYFGTLKEAFQVITSLQTLISILESADQLPKYQFIYYKNVRTLRDYGLTFPFEFNQFLEAKNISENTNQILSVYSAPANELLI